MLLGRLNKVIKSYGDREVLNIDEFKIFEGERIGIVGENGAGKSTFIRCLIGDLPVDSGEIYLNESYSYISQGTDCSDGDNVSTIYSSILTSPGKYSENLSGGEKIKFKITKAFNKGSKLIIGDEITSNLDSESIKALENLLVEFRGALLLVSHDRSFLDNLCDTILEIKDGRIKRYRGNYSKYLIIKENENLSTEREFEKYVKEKKRLEKAIVNKEESRDSIRRTPKRMGNSEARLHKMGGQKGKKNIDNNIKALKSRIEHLEVKEKPKTTKEIKIRIQEGKEIFSKNIIQCSNLNLKVGNKVLINEGNFIIKKGYKVGLIGGNGTGKTTLLKEIIKGNSNIKVNSRVEIGYFDQEQKILDEYETILENIKVHSNFDEGFIRTCLDGFGFKGNDVYKKVNILSGGEKVKISLCKILLEDNNFLILDEPTNYLDIRAIEALENVLIGTEKGIIIVSHDRNLISKVCNFIIEIHNLKLKSFEGSYNEYKEWGNGKERNKGEDNKLLLETRLTDVISRLSMEKNDENKKVLEEEYYKILKDIKRIN